MNPQIEYLKSKPEISNVLAQGFAQIYHHKPQFPVTFLAQFLKNHNQLQDEKKSLIRKLVNNQTLREQLKRQEETDQNNRLLAQQKLQHKKQRQEAFQFRIKECLNHNEFLNQYCEWIEKEKSLTGVYIGELQNQFKSINFDKEDSQEAHIDLQAPRIVKFKAASHSHNQLMLGKSLGPQSVLGKLLSEKDEGGEQEQGKKQAKPKGEIYIPLVQQNKQLIFFRYPRLGSFYAIVMKIKSYLHQKIFDSNLVKTQVYRKAKQEYDKQQEQRQSKFRQLYDERQSSGADQKQLQQLEANFQKEEQNFPKPKLQEFEYIQREFVVCFDTIGLDRQISEDERQYCRYIVAYLKEQWQAKERQLLQKDIDSQLKLLAEQGQVPLAQVFTKLLEQEEKELQTHEQVQKNKNNQKLFQLELNTLKAEKIKQYIEEQKFGHYLDILLERNVIKFPQIMKLFLIYAGFRKEDINFKGTNLINWRKAKQLLNKEEIYSKINHFVLRGSKPKVAVDSYAKWQRILKCLEKYDQVNVASYNMFLAMVLRFLQLSGKVRIADRQARKTAAKLERQAREQKIKEAEVKTNEKLQKLQAAKTQAQAKEEVLDEQNWLRVYEEQNPPIDIGEEVVEEKDEDLEQQSAQVPAQ